MAKHPPWLKAAVAGIAACGLAAASASLAQTPRCSETRLAYLKAIGPAALRVQPPPRVLPWIALSSLFPPRTHRTAAESAATTNAPGPVTLAAVHPPSTPVSTPVTLAVPLSPTETSSLLALPMSIEKQGERNPAVDSRTLLEYLAPQTTNALRGAPPRWPVFVPPVTPPPTPSSQATYQSP